MNVHLLSPSAGQVCDHRDRHGEGGYEEQELGERMVSDQPCYGNVSSLALSPSHADILCHCVLAPNGACH